MYWVDIALSFVLLVVGYISVCCYLSGDKLSEFKLISLKLTKNRLLYLLVGVVTVAALVICLNATYAIELITRLNLITLVLIILPASAVDLKLQKIPNVFLLAGLAIRLVFFAMLYIQNVGNAWIVTKDSLIGALVIGLFFLLLLVVFKNSIGMGDIKLFALMGLYQGLWGVINSVFFSLTVSFFISVALLITKKRGRKDTISFGPSIYLGTIIAMCMAGM